MQNKPRVIVHCGFAIALSTQICAVAAQERPNQQKEQRGSEAPPRPEDGKQKEEDGKSNQKQDTGKKGRESRRPPEGKPANKGGPESPSKGQVTPALPKSDAEKAAPSSDKPEPPESRKGKPNVPPVPSKSPVDVQPPPAPKQDQPVIIPPKAATTPPRAPDIGKKSSQEPAQVAPDGDLKRRQTPVGPGRTSPAESTLPAVPAPSNSGVQKPASTQQASPVPPAAQTPPPGVLLPAAPSSAGAAKTPVFQPGFQPAGAVPQKLQDVQKGRTERVEDGGKRTVIQESDNRVIIKQNNRSIIRHDETQRFAKNATAVKSEKRADGTTQTIIVQPGGIQIFNIVDTSGRTVRRYRRDERGQEINIIDNRSFYRAGAAIGIGLVVGAEVLALRPPDIRISREKYIVDYDRASDDDVYEALTAPPIEQLERQYSLDEVRYSHELRDRMRRLDLDAVTFEFGSWEVSPAQFPKLERVARIMDRILEKKPGEVFLVEGHTDAVGSDIDNLTLSDRRAQAVAEILTGVFRVPAENLVTQGYGEQYLKVPTQAAEPANRRVAIRRITPLMSASR